MADIYNNTSAFGLCSEEMQEAFRAHFDSGGKLEHYTPRGWETKILESFYETSVYRAVYKKPDWPDYIADWVNFIAQDEDGKLWAYATRPWWENVQWVTRASKHTRAFVLKLDWGDLPPEQRIIQRPE